MQHAALGERTRVNAYLAFLGAAGLPFDETLMVDGAQSRRSAHEAVLKLLKVSERPTALIAESDFAAVTALNSFQAAGLKVPADIAVVGCGNIDEGLFSYPRLTTIGPQEASFSHLADHCGRSDRGQAHFTLKGIRACPGPSSGGIRLEPIMRLGRSSAGRIRFAIKNARQQSEPIPRPWK